MTDRCVTAIVVVHGSPEATVRRCVESLLASESVRVSVILIDNASPDGGAACAPWNSHERVTLIRSEENRGFAAGVNQGLARRPSDDLVFLLNDDATLAPDCIVRCAAALDGDQTIISVAPRVMLADEPDRIDSIGVVLRPNGEAFNAFIGQRWTGQVANGSEVLGPCFAAALFRPDAFDAHVVGTLDERYRLYYEDIDWSLRARRAGFRCIAATDAIVHHQHAASTRTLGEPARYELVQRNLLLCATKNLGLRSVVHVWSQRFVVHGKGVIKGPYRTQRLRALSRAVVGAPSALAARRHLPGGRANTDEELFEWSVGQSPNFDAETLRTIE